MGAYDLNFRVSFHYHNVVVVIKMVPIFIGHLFSMDAYDSVSQFLFLHVIMIWLFCITKVQNEGSRLILTAAGERASWRESPASCRHPY